MRDEVLAWPSAENSIYHGNFCRVELAVRFF